MAITTSGYEIIFNETFIIYNDEFIIGRNVVIPYDLEVVFKKEAVKNTYIESKGDDLNKKIEISIYNFNYSLGGASSIPLEILTLNDGKKVYFSIYCQVIGQKEPYPRHVSVSLLKK
jgi:hypothetical protein